jgi:hypothetical protein
MAKAGGRRSLIRASGPATWVRPTAVRSGLARGRLFISLRAEVDGVPRHRVLTWRRAASASLSHCPKSLGSR